jgi:hypothetical protein
LARKAGVRLAMSVEHSGHAGFDFEYGEDFARHIEDFDPDLATALVRCNPEGGPGINARQVARMTRLSEWCHKTGRTFLFELLVPPTTAETGSARPLFEADMVVHAAGRAPSTTVSPPPSGYSMVPA